MYLLAPTTSSSTSAVVSYDVRKKTNSIADMLTTMNQHAGFEVTKLRMMVTEIIILLAYNYHTTIILPSYYQHTTNMLASTLQNSG